MAETAAIDTDAVRQVQEYIRREFNALLRPLTHPVYHYTDGAAAIAILEDAKLRATNILYLDDGRDMAHSVEFFREALAVREQRNPGGVTAELAALIQQYLSEVGGYVPPDIWIATFSSERDSARRWQTVGGCGHAVAVGFSANGIMRGAETGGALLAPCCYDDDTKLAIMMRGIELAEKLYEKRRVTFAKSPGAGVALVRYVLRELALFGALMKQSDLKGEDEWRVILCNPSQTAVGARRIHAVAKSDYTSLYIDLEIADATDRLPICEILVGPSPHQQMTARAFWTLLYKHGYERADVIQSAL
ncbi:MAG TPA: hypothetical protein VH722_14580 [Alphaproteobacteria bacterium]|nr:hypothetical protein [Alphaproteobacteria bacterium]